MYSIKEYTVFSTQNQKIYYLRNKKANHLVRKYNNF